jgi:hypothetical protein
MLRYIEHGLGDRAALLVCPVDARCIHGDRDRFGLPGSDFDAA